MLQVVPQMKIYVACEAVDFRKGIDTLGGYCRQKLNKDPFSGALFLFRNRSRTALKILIYDGQGFWLCTKRLSRGKLRWWPSQGKAGVCMLAANELMTLLWNGNPKGAKFEPEWRRLNASAGD
jgi:transposase